jgi:hypothetical protein
MDCPQLTGAARTASGRPFLRTADAGTPTQGAFSVDIGHGHMRARGRQFQNLMHLEVSSGLDARFVLGGRPALTVGA